MHTKGVDGLFTDFDDFTGLIPLKRFISFCDGNGLPNEAHNGVFEGLLEPEPRSWIQNPEFPYLWRYLFYEIYKEEEIVLLSFELKPEDKVYVVERAHVERELYREIKNQGKGTIKTRQEAFRKYWESRVPVFQYDGGYSLPQLTSWSGIPFERLRLEWTKPSGEVLKRISNNNW